MKKLFALVLGAVFGFSSIAQAQEASGSTLKANFRRVGLEYSQKSINHARENEGVSDSEFTADDEEKTKGVFDFVLERNASDWTWNNGVYAEYEETKTEDKEDHHKTKVTSADKILLSSDYNYKLWKTADYSVGPTAIVEYQTKFKDSAASPRSKIIRFKAGFKLFDHEVIKELYLVGVGEHDMTHHDHVSKTAWEAGWRLEKKVRENVVASTDGFYRRYTSFSSYNAYDYRYELKANAYLDANITDTMSIGPYASYHRIHARGISKYGSNFTVGVALTFKNIYDVN
ncbi:MAG: hypothetical protein MJ247_04920 [Alphaproteobacteria bacterium]|nr:hypothetical protein [Alphaproteobacteria bacterium]